MVNHPVRYIISRIIYNVINLLRTWLLLIRIIHYDALDRLWDHLVSITIASKRAIIKEKVPWLHYNGIQLHHFIVRVGFSVRPINCCLYSLLLLHTLWK